MTDVLHSLSVKLNQPNHLATLGCFIEGIADVVQEVVVTTGSGGGQPRGGGGCGGQPRGKAPKRTQKKSR